mmetsp:Transcript_20932/g.49370  ORF Transcript_20932/g.49370 Transcript_20932/m.49370 type:complete len:300 (+) Transcript_20932:1817-2716(+)
MGIVRRPAFSAIESQKKYNARVGLLQDCLEYRPWQICKNCKSVVGRACMSVCLSCVFVAVLFYMGRVVSVCHAVPYESKNWLVLVVGIMAASAAVTSVGPVGAAAILRLNGRIRVVGGRPALLRGEQPVLAFPSPLVLVAVAVAAAAAAPVAEKKSSASHSFERTRACGERSSNSTRRRGHNRRRRPPPHRSAGGSRPPYCDPHCSSRTNPTRRPQSCRGTPAPAALPSSLPDCPSWKQSLACRCCRYPPDQKQLCSWSPRPHTYSGIALAAAVGGPRVGVGSPKTEPLRRPNQKQPAA